MTTQAAATDWIATESGGEGPPLVLIHGVGTNRTIWSLSVPGLAVAHRVTTLDLPGFGHSPAPEGEWSLSAVAELIAETLSTDIGAPFSLLGSSLGGAVALELAAAHPDLVSELLLVSPAGFRPAPGPLPRLAAAAAGPMLAARRLAGLRLADQRHARRALLAGTVGDGAALEPDAARLMLRASEGAVSLGPAFRAAAGADLRALAAELQAPIGLIWGSLDRVIPAHTAERILELHPDAPVEVITGAGHIPHLEAPQRFVAAVERILAQLAPRVP